MMSREENPLPVQRRQQIMFLLESEGQVVATELSHRFAVSEDTIRRDLRELANNGLVRRVHGGAVLRATDADWTHREREHSRSEVKQTLATAAISLLRSGQVVILDAGTTNQQIAAQLPSDLQITIVTNCPHIAIAAAEHGNVSIIMSGGKLNKSMQALTGVATATTFQGINADMCFIGACAVHAEYGICGANDDEVLVKRAMLAAAAESVVVATADKLGTVEPYKIATAQQINYLITEQSASQDALAPFFSAGLSVLQA